MENTETWRLSPSPGPPGEFRMADSKFKIQEQNRPGRTHGFDFCALRFDFLFATATRRFRMSSIPRGVRFPLAPRAVSALRMARHN